ncbi:MAG TPA: hypothetical protein VFX59_24535, partial [Polyangiales bacterium]|nr:hypothetical protein [Polyangiales bacterium]
YTKLASLLKDNPVLAYSSELEGNEALARLRTEHAMAVLRLRSFDATGGADERAEAQVRANLQVLEAQIRTLTDGVLRGARAELEETQQIEKDTQAELTKVNATARALQKVAAELGPFERERGSDEQMLRTLRERAAARASHGRTVSEGHLLQPAVPASRPRPTRPGRNSGVALLSGLCIAALVEFFCFRRARQRS